MVLTKDDHVIDVVRRDVEVENAPSAMVEDEPDVEQLERRGLLNHYYREAA